jgi:uncharacterized protein YciI
MSYFIAVSEQGPAWVAGRGMREQSLWTEHAAFINGLAASGFIVLGGPLRGGPRHRAMLIVVAPSEEEARRRLLQDPWMTSEMLRIQSVEPWEILVSSDRLDRALAEILRAGRPRA